MNVEAYLHLCVLHLLKVNKTFVFVHVSLQLGRYKPSPTWKEVDMEFICSQADI